MTILETSWVQGTDREIEELVRLVNEAIALELNASRLYALFQDLFPDDGEFWQALSIEEENHANLLRNGRRLFLPEGRFPRELLPESLEPLVEKNRELESLFDRYEQTLPAGRRPFGPPSSLRSRRASSTTSGPWKAGLPPGPSRCFRR